MDINNNTKITHDLLRSFLRMIAAGGIKDQARFAQDVLDIDLRMLPGRLGLRAISHKESIESAIRWASDSERVALRELLTLHSGFEIIINQLNDRIDELEDKINTCQAVIEDLEASLNNYRRVCAKYLDPFCL